MRSRRAGCVATMRRRNPACTGRPTSATCASASKRRALSWRRPVPADVPNGAGGPRSPYDYAVIRVMPRVERGESINVGVIVSCPEVAFLDARIELDVPRLLALDDTLDPEAIRTSLATIPTICRGGPEAGPIGALPQRNRFHWLVSPRSTVIQPSPVHTGRTGDPAAALDRLLETMVRRRSAGSGSPGGTGEI